MKIGLLRRYVSPMTKDMVAALIAKEHQAEVIFFQASGIDFENRLIRGLTLQHGDWVNSVSYFPDVVYNDVPLKKDEKLYERLEQSGIPFTTHRFGVNKKTFQRRMSENPYLSAFSIPTITYQGFQSLEQALAQFKQIFLKPNRGHKGDGMYIIEQKENNLLVTDTEGTVNRFNKEEAESFFNLHVNEFFHIQPKFTATTQAGDPYVIRSYVGKDGTGKWKAIFHYAAIGLNKNPIVNVSQGSSISYIQPFLKTQFGDQHHLISKKLKENAIRVAEQTEAILGFKIDALGLDICLTSEGDYYLYEVNAFPGTRPFEALVEKFAVPYALSLKG
ncbi:YheC/YheD family protein [Jeotgalibacillus haloalkalitolerans]|uniref:YheC/YheD family protein n=1 Tax=Jeotgalibacillus haloalkalitolerans TaxID=3104292 RepID=A0ABU5KJZ6_9BACL|nr:YheC/YheD family protein [Jeotgalibacillus sp. HH7-29]MDZ5711403.1 YheC/YheD family protein [Jeotgalibacillus sp. HH7-29]